MFANLSSAAAGTGGFPVTQLITVVVLLAVLYPVQKRIRAAASRHRHERWKREGLLEQRPPQALSTDFDPQSSDPAEEPRDVSAKGDDPREG